MMLLYSDPVFLKHETDHQPENPARILPAVHQVNQIAMPAGGRVVSALEGGYNPQALAGSIEHHLVELTSV